LSINIWYSQSSRSNPKVNATLQSRRWIRAAMRLILAADKRRREWLSWKSIYYCTKRIESVITQHRVGIITLPYLSSESYLGGQGEIPIMTVHKSETAEKRFMQDYLLWPIKSELSGSIIRVCAVLPAHLI
jgi:hypothetical protein